MEAIVGVCSYVVLNAVCIISSVPCAMSPFRHCLFCRCVYWRLSCFRALLVTYLAPKAHITLAAVRGTDWGSEPAVFVQPPHWPKGKPSASANYKRALVAAEQSGADFALVLEDDVRVCRHLRHNLSTIPIVSRRQADCLTLFIPDLIADPWERCEPYLGYRLAEPRVSQAP